MEKTGLYQDGAFEPEASVNAPLKTKDKALTLVSGGGGRVLLRPMAMGMASSILLLLVYAGIVALTSRSLVHVQELMSADGPFVGAISLGFGLQMGLYTYLRKGLRIREGRGPTALAASGAGTSTVSMIACCAHHAVDILPLVGLASAGLFLSQYRTPLMALGLLSNGIGIAITLRLIRKRRQEVCHA